MFELQVLAGCSGVSFGTSGGTICDPPDLLFSEEVTKRLWIASYSFLSVSHPDGAQVS